MPPTRSMRSASATTTRIISAHRTPDRLYAFAKGAKAAGFKVIIAGAGGAAHLPGMTAALTSLPVFGVPVESKALSGQDSLYSIVQMPPGVPVGTLAIGQAGADQCGAAGGERVGAERSGAGQAARSLARTADRRCRRRAEGFERVSAPVRVLEPGATIGILGGGQLGRMLALAAARLGFKCHVFAPDPGFAGLRRGATGDRAPTTPTRGARPLRRERRCRHLRIREHAGGGRDIFLPRAFRCCPIRKSWRRPRTVLPKKISSPVSALAPRLRRRRDGRRSCAAAIERIGRPAVLKTRRFGYDGKGQVTIKNGTDT